MIYNTFRKNIADNIIIVRRNINIPYRCILYTCNARPRGSPCIIRDGVPSKLILWLCKVTFASAALNKLLKTFFPRPFCGHTNTRNRTVFFFRAIIAAPGVGVVLKMIERQTLHIIFEYSIVRDSHEAVRSIKKQMTLPVSLDSTRTGVHLRIRTYTIQNQKNKRPTWFLWTGSHLLWNLSKTSIGN